MSLPIDDVFVAFRSDTQDLERGVNKAVSELGKLADYVIQKPTIAIAGMSVALAGVAFSAAQAAAGVETAMVRIANAIPGAAGKTSDLRDIIDQTANAGGRLTDEVQGVADVIAHEGVASVEAFTQRLALVALTANATGGSLTDTATGLHGLQVEFGLTDDQLQKVVVSLFGLTQGKVPIEELTDGIIHAAPAVRALGLDLDTTERAMAALIERGLSVKQASAELDKYAKLGATGKDDILALANSVTIAADSFAKFTTAAKAAESTEEAQYNRVKNQLSQAWIEFGTTVLPVVTTGLKNANAELDLYGSVAAAAGRAVAGGNNLTIGPAAIAAAITFFKQASTGADALTTAADKARDSLAALGVTSKGLTSQPGILDAANPLYQAPASAVGIPRQIPTADQERADQAAQDKATAGLKEFNAQLADLHAKALEAQAAMGGPLLAAWETLNAEIDKSLTALKSNKYGTTAGINQAATDAAALRQQFWAKALSDYLADSAKYAAAFEDSTKQGLADSITLVADLNDKLKGTDFAAAAQHIVDTVMPQKDVIKQLQDLFAAWQLGQKNIAEANRETAADQQKVFDRTQEVATAQSALDVATLEAAGKTHAARLRDLDDRQAAYEKTLQQRVLEDASYAATAKHLTQISQQQTDLAKQAENVANTASIHDAIAQALQDGAQLLASIGGIDPELQKAIKSVVALGSALNHVATTWADPLSTFAERLTSVAGAITVGAPAIADILGLSGESAAQKAQDARNEQLIDALDHLRSAFQSYTDIVVSGKAATALASSPLLSEATSRPVPGGISAVQQRLNELGISLDDFNAEAKSLGVTIGSSVNPSIADFNNVIQASRLQEFTAVAKTFAGQLGLLQTGFKILGTTNTDQFAQTVKLLTDPVVGAPAIFAPLEGVDVSTVAGAKQASDIIASIFDAFNNHTLSNADFGDLDPQQFFDALTGLKGLIPQQAAAATGADQLAARLAALQQGFAVFGTTVADQVNATLATLANAGSDALKQALSGLDASTADGRAAIVAKLRDLYHQVTDGYGNALDLGAVSADELANVINLLTTSFSDAGDAGELVALNIRNLTAEGDTKGAAAVQRAIDEAKELSDAIAAGLDDATIQQIKYTQALEDSTAASKAAADQAKAEQDEKDALQVRLLRAQGDTAGADALQRQIDESTEIADAIAKGFDQATIDQIKATQGAEDAAAAQAATAANASAAAGSSTANGNQVTVTSNVGETLDLVGLAESANALLSEIVGNTASLRYAAGPLRPPALPAGFGQPVTQAIANMTITWTGNVVVNLSGAADPDAAAAAGHAAGQAAAQEINRQLGAIKLRQDYNRGINRAVGV